MDKQKVLNVIATYSVDGLVSAKLLTDIIMSGEVDTEPCEYCAEMGSALYVKGVTIPPENFPYRFCPICGRVLRAKYDCKICDEARKNGCDYCPMCGKKLKEEKL